VAAPVEGLLARVARRGRALFEREQEVREAPDEVELDAGEVRDDDGPDGVVAL
jgi:hypothetical protein